MYLPIPSKLIKCLFFLGVLLASSSFLSEDIRAQDLELDPKQNQRSDAETSIFSDAPPLHEAYVIPKKSLSSLSAQSSKSLSEELSSEGKDSVESDEASNPKDQEKVKTSPSVIPLEVEIETPRALRQPIIIRWNQPIISQLNRGENAKINLEITPPIEGELIWQGTRSVIFKPVNAWPRASQFNVTLKGPISAVSGAQIDESFQTIKMFRTERNKVRQVTLAQRSYINGKQDLSWTDELSKETLIKICFAQKTPTLPPLSLFTLRKVKNGVLSDQLRVAYDHDQSLFNRTHYYQSEMCVGLKVLDPIEPFTEYELHVNAGLESLEGSLLSTQDHTEQLESEKRLELVNVQLDRRELYLNFNRPLPRSTLYDQIYLLPEGMNPNRMSAQDLKANQRLKEPQGLPTSAKQGTATQEKSTRNHSFRYTAKPTETLSIWLRPYAIRLSDHNHLSRQSISHLTKERDEGYPWLLSKVGKPDLGYVSAESLPSFMTVEQLNQPTQTLTFYGIDHLCLDWFHLEARQIAEYDLIGSYDLEIPKELKLSREIEPLCIQQFDPRYIYRKRRFPVVPYRFAVRGSNQEWSFVQEATEDQSSLLDPPKYTERSPLGLPLAVNQPCSADTQPCALEKSPWESFYEWGRERPSLFSGSGAHLYLLDQRWHWQPKSENISFSSYQGERGQGAERILRQHSLVQATRYGLIAKLNDEGGQVWMWDLFSHESVKGAEVIIYASGGDRVGEAITDSMGIAKLNLDQEKILAARAKLNQRDPKNPRELSFYISANYKGDHSLVTSSSQHQIYEDGSYQQYHAENPYIYSKGQWTQVNHRRRGSLWTDRGIYRAGDPIYFGAVVAKVGVRGVEPIREELCELSLRDRDDKEMSNLKVRSTRLGAISAEFKIPSKANLGQYQASLICPSSEHPLVWTHEFKVAAFRRPQFKVDAFSDASRVLSGAPLAINVRAKYLYGAPMHEKSWQAYLSSEAFQPQPRGKIGSQEEIDLSAYNYGPPLYQEWGDSEINAVLSEHYPQYRRYNHFNYESDHLSGELDIHGEAREQLEPKIDGLYPYRLKVSWSVTDSDDQVLGAQNTISAHPTTGYIGLRSLDGEYVPSGGDHRTELIWVNSLNDEIGSPRDMEIKLFHVTWSRIALKDEVGRERIESQRKITEVGRCDLKAVSTPKVCTLRPLQSGEHIWVAEAKDDRGIKTMTAISTYLYGGSDGTWREREGSQIDLRLTNERPVIGEEIGVLVESPYEEAEAWITVEREGIVYSKRQRVKASQMVKIPVSEEMAPNAWIKVILTRPRVSLPYVKSTSKSVSTSGLGSDQELISDFDESSQFDLGRPVELYGLKEINVALTPAELRVTVTPDAKEKRPGDSLSVDVTLRDHMGETVSGEVFLWALDEGVARLTAYQLPPLYDALHSRRTNRVETFSHLSRLVSHYTLGRKGNPVGGGGDEESGGNERPRADFRATPFFVGVAQVDASGTATITRSLPDDLTTFKLYAIALSERASSSKQSALLRAGSGEAEVTVNLPLMIRPALPRTLTVGDRVQLGAVVSSLLTTPLDLEVRYEISGPATALNGVERRVSVPSKGNVVTRAPYLITGLGELKVKLSLYRNGKLEDLVEETVHVKPPAQAEFFAQSGDLLVKDAQTASSLLIDLRTPKKSDDASSNKIEPLTVRIQSQLGIELGVSAVNMIFGEFVGLLEYPYGCLEQRSSRILPYALASTLQIPVKQSSSESETESQSVIADYLTTLETMQRQSGGLAYWPNESSQVHKWASAYAFIVLNELKRAGHDISRVDLKRLSDFLKRSRPKGEPKQKGDHIVNRDTAALIAFALSEYSTAEYQLEETLLKSTDRLGLSGQLLLAASLGGSLESPTSGARREAARKLYQEAMKHFSFDGERLQVRDDQGAWSWWSFGSPEQQLAIALIATLRVDPESDLVMPLLKSLASTARTTQYLNTQAAAFKLLAMRDYVKKKESIVPKIQVDLSMIERQSNTRALSPWKTFTLDAESSRQVSAHRGVYLDDEVRKEDPTERVVEGLEIKASGQGQLYYSQRVKRYPQSVQNEPIDRGYTLSRVYRLEVPANATDAQLRALYRTDLSQAQQKLLRPQSLSYQLGDIVQVELTLEVPHDAYYLVVNDPLPAGLEIIDPSLKGASTIGSNSSSQWSVFDHVELRDDRVLLFADQINKGLHTFRYLARATSVGRFLRPAAIAQEMYDPQNMGRSDGGYVWIRDRE